MGEVRNKSNGQTSAPLPTRNRAALGLTLAVIFCPAPNGQVHGEDSRAALISGLREMADFMEAHPELPEPVSPIQLDSFTRGENAKRELAEIARQLGGCEKGGDGNYFFLRKYFGSIHWDFNASRPEVCTRKVVGIELVPEKIVPAHEVEKVEWVCEPLLESA